MVMKTHDISRLRFLDFEPWVMALDLSFNVCGIQMEQDIISAYGDRRVQMFRIHKGK